MRWYPTSRGAAAHQQVSRSFRPGRSHCARTAPGCARCSTPGERECRHGRTTQALARASCAEAATLAARLDPQVVQVPMLRHRGVMSFNPQQDPGRQRQSAAKDRRHRKRLAKHPCKRHPPAPRRGHTAAPLPSSVIQTGRCSGVRFSISAVKKARRLGSRVGVGSRCAQVRPSANASASASAATSCSSDRRAGGFCPTSISP